jgi:hypothetical protein
MEKKETLTIDFYQGVILRFIKSMQSDIGHISGLRIFGVQVSFLTLSKFLNSLRMKTLRED